MAKHLAITGKVQGVGYRASFEAKARMLNLDGWVRNRIDGSVEAMVRGDERAVNELLAWAQRGPTNAVVREVSITEIDDTAVSDGFDVLPTQ